MQSARFQDLQLRGRVNIQIGQRIYHGIEMTGLTSEIEKKLSFLDERGHGCGVTNIGPIDSHAVANTVNIKEIAAVLRNQAVDQDDPGAQLDQSPRQGRANKAKTPGDKDIGASKNLVGQRHGRIVGRRQKDFL